MNFCILILIKSDHSNDKQNLIHGNSLALLAKGLLSNLEQAALENLAQMITWISYYNSFVMIS